MDLLTYFASCQKNNMKFLKLFLKDMYVSSTDLNKKNIESLFDKNRKAHLLDLGCDDGVLTMRYAKIIGTKTITGVDIIASRLKVAKSLGIKTVKANLNEVLPIKTSTIDVIHANQVIEHIGDLDTFASEMYRVLKPGGYALVSTENGSSWVNIVAAIMGWQIFSSTNMSGKRLGIGNPFSIHGDEVLELSSWTHKTIFNIRGLREFLEVHGFEIVDMKGAGYFPLPAMIGNIDKTHCHFMTFKVRKPLSDSTSK